MIAIDEREAGPNAQESCSRRLVFPREMWRVARQFDGGTEERGGQRVRRKDEYRAEAHVVVLMWFETGQEAGTRASRKTRTMRGFHRRISRHLTPDPRG